MFSTRRSLLLLIGLPLAFVATAMAGDVVALTNDAIVKMVKTGLGEGLILSMIQSQPGRYTLTPDDLLRLKGQGVSEAILTAMVGKFSGTSGNVDTTIPPVGDLNDPMVPHDSGIYVYTKDRDGKPKMIALERASYQGTKMGIGPCSFTGGLIPCKLKAILPGASASIRTDDSNPVFYFYFDDKAPGLGGRSYFAAGNVSNPNQFSLVKLEVKKSNRETVISKAGAGGISWGTDAHSMVDFKSERIRTGLYKVVLSTPPLPGQYCFSSTMAGAWGLLAGGGGDLLDFAVSERQ